MSEPTPGERRKTTRLQDIALAYVERYWGRLHPEDRLEFLLVKLTSQERRRLVERIDEVSRQC